MTKTWNNRAWFLVLPVLIIVALNAIIPLMTVVNYSVQDTFGNNVFFFEGAKWFREVMSSERFHAALGRQLIFTLTILAIEIPLGVIIALAMPKKGVWASVCLVLMALPLLIPWNVVGAMWNIFACPISASSLWPQLARHPLQLHAGSGRRLVHHHHHGCVALDEPCGAARLCRAAIDR